MNREIQGTGEKKEYHRPVLTEFGDVRTLTLNASANVYEQQFESRSRRGEEDSRGGRRGDD